MEKKKGRWTFAGICSLPAFTVGFLKWWLMGSCVYGGYGVVLVLTLKRFCVGLRFVCFQLLL